MSIVPGRDIPEAPETWVDAVNAAINNENHDDLCRCDLWPQACESGYWFGQWDLGSAAVHLAAAALEPLIREKMVPETAPPLATDAPVPAFVHAAEYTTRGRNTASTQCGAEGGGVADSRKVTCPACISAGSEVDSVATLAALLPASVRERIEPELLTEPPTAAALRVLATIRDPRWHEHVRGARIYWADLIAWTRAECAVDSPVRVRVEIAASLAGYADARPDLFRSARVLDRENCAAVLDAMRIARTGVVR